MLRPIPNNPNETLFSKTANIIYKELQAIYLMLYKRQILNHKNHKI